MKKYIIFIFLVTVVTACNNKKPEAVPIEETPSELTDSAKLINDYDSLIVTEARAAVDSTFAQSDEYKASHEAYQQMLEKMTKGMDETDASLCQLETAASSLYNNGKHFASDTQLMRDPVNQQRMRITAQKAQELGKKIQGMALTPDQQVLFDSLKTIIHL